MVNQALKESLQKCSYFELRVLQKVFEEDETFYSTLPWSDEAKAIAQSSLKPNILSENLRSEVQYRERKARWEEQRGQALIPDTVAPPVAGKGTVQDGRKRVVKDSTVAATSASRLLTQKEIKRKKCLKEAQRKRKRREKCRLCAAVTGEKPNHIGGDASARVHHAQRHLQVIMGALGDMSGGKWSRLFEINWAQVFTVCFPTLDPAPFMRRQLHVETHHTGRDVTTAFPYTYEVRKRIFEKAREDPELWDPEDVIPEYGPVIPRPSSSENATPMKKRPRPPAPPSKFHRQSVTGSNASSNTNDVPSCSSNSPVLVRKPRKGNSGFKKPLVGSIGGSES